MENGAVQMIDGDGKFNPAEVEQFVQATGLSNSGNSYVVVSIMGPQSSDNILELGSRNVMEKASADVLPKLNGENPLLAEMSFEAACLKNEVNQGMSSFCGNDNANHNVSGRQIYAIPDLVSVKMNVSS
ncbi:hypothetical protein COLO4_15028 [Corchorus olitorius]|uniref:Uncharacterized protein n=1 Tax=Corchorus olitorius TaxID=93759 RepID=A0A1R3JPZ2_9ROSI|nr:hypothetical protein COLO4_15028 [Corchorus olitorius]